MYRSIGINRTGVTAVCQIRAGVPEPLRGVEWLSFGSTTFAAMLPVYTNVSRMPKYLSGVETELSTETFYWGSRLIAALADPHYAACIQQIERYQDAVAIQGRTLLREYDSKVAEGGDLSLLEEANEALANMAREQTLDTLGKVLQEASQHMKNGFNRADN